VFIGRRRRRDQEIDDEIDAHVRLAEEDLIGRGLSPAEARRQARLEAGGVVPQLKQQVRDADSAAWPHRIAREARDAVRGLRRTPGIAAAAILLIALVIGGNTTIFSMIYAILSKPARGVTAAGLVTFETRRGAAAGPTHSYPDYVDYTSGLSTVPSVLADQFERFTLGLSDGSYAFTGGLVSRNYFDTLGVRLVRGRSFTPQEEQLDASGLVAVVSYRIWQDQLHGTADVVGQPIVLNGHDATVVGVAPEDFLGPWLGASSQIWVPLPAYLRVSGHEQEMTDRSGGPLLSIGQLAPGASLTEAQAEVTALMSRLAREYPKTNRGKTVRLVPYSVTAGGDSAVAEHGWQFLAVFSIVTLLTVLIVCANVANLMLARAAVRQRELAVRQSLGASRASLVRTLLFEGLIVSLIAWAASCLLAFWTSLVLPRWLTPPAGAGTSLPLDFTPDWRVVTYAMLLALCGTVAFTLPPSVRAWRQDVLPWLRDGEQSIIQGRTRLSSALVVLQLSFAVLLRTAAGLGYRSVSLLGGRELGFPPEGLLLATVNTAGSAANAGANQALLERVRARLRSIPGVEAVSYTTGVPSRWWSQVSVRETSAQDPVFAERSAVGPDYLRALGLAPLAGREFGEDAPPDARTEAMINQNLAGVLWPGRQALGRTLLVGPDKREATVTAVVPNALFSGISRSMHPNFVLLAQRQQPAGPGEMTFYIRYAGALDTMAPGVGAALRSVDPRVAIVFLRTMTTELDSTTWPIRLISLLLVVFAGASFVVAAIGQYAVVAFDMRRRTRDFGIRIALGASSRQIVGAVLSEGFRWTAAGLVMGFALSLAAGQAARNLLFGVTPTDAWTYIGVFALLAAASLLACYLPARRAARTSPMTALRHE
jgi:predicted permease